MTRQQALQIAKPILFNTDMVRAILDERKTVTRRLIKPPYYIDDEDVCRKSGLAMHVGINATDGMPYPDRPCKIGDILYVRETWCKGSLNYGDEQYYYKADDTIPYCTWNPSIHMPKEAARIFLQVTDVRVESLQDITEEQAIREGIARLYDYLPDAEYIDWTKRTNVYPKAKADWGYKNYLWHGNFGMYGTGNKLSDAWEYQCSAYDSPIDSFSSLWNTTVPLKDWNIYGWNANPWVWGIAFERIEV